MSVIRAFIQKITQVRPLYLQLVFTALAFLAMVVLSYIFMSAMVRSYLVHHAENVLAITQLEIESVLQESEAVHLSFSQTVRRMILQGGNLDALQEYMTEITEYLMANNDRESRINNVYGYFTTLAGESAYLNSKRWVPPDSYVPQSRPWYQAAIAAGGRVVATSPYLSMATGELVFTYVRSLYDDDGRRIGVACIDVPIDIIGNDVVKTAMAQGGYGMLLDRNLTMLAHPYLGFVGKNLRDLLIPAALFVDDLKEGMEIFERSVTGFRGEPSVAFFRELPNGWHLGLITPKGPYYQSVTNMALLLSALGAVLAAALIYVLVRIDAAKNKSDEESKYKSAFLANMSHEMRTPLNAVIGLSQLILEDEGLSEEGYSKLKKVYNSGLTLLNTVNDILDISKIEAGKFELASAAYDVPSMINDAVVQSILHIKEKPVRFILNIEKNLFARLCGDELRVKQVLSNLLSNAFKYTKEGEVELRIDCEREGDSVWMSIRVRDTGIGIRPEHIASLFDDYSQIDPITNRKVMGTGLGLPITKRLLGLMNGSIAVESEHGKGSVFTARLLQKFMTDAVIGPETVESLRNFNYSEKKRQMDSGLTPRISLPYARVLIVDDVTTNLDVAKGLMSPYNMRIDCVLSGQEAINAIQNDSVRYNAVFMDHMMPVMDGLETARRIRELGTDYAKNIPIIALTANAIVGNEAMFLNEGFQAFIPKPIEVSKLDAVIREWLRDKEQESLYLRRQKELSDQALPGDQLKNSNIANLDVKSLDGIKNLGDIKSLDIGKGIKRFGGDENSYLRILRSYSANTPQLIESVKDVSRDNLASYVITVHGIKGSSRGICANALADAAEALEKAAQAGDYDFVVANNAAFLEIAGKLLSEINEVLLLAHKNSPKKPKMYRPDEKALLKLLKACMSYDMDGADRAMAEIESYEYEQDDGLAVWLREKVEQMNFPQIVEKLSYLNK